MSLNTPRIYLLPTLILLSISTHPIVHAEEAVDSLFDLTLEELRNVKIKVASLNEETISQSPVPVSLITSDMIKQSGALTLKELLLTYVPGFNDIEDQNEINIASRGVYTSSQQKILIMINGHRLNSRSYSMAAPDSSISLDKIKHIEVLRGPASSLYGNVSLTATINIILKKAKETDTRLKALVGDYGQRGLSFMSSYQDGNVDGIIWASTYQSDGEVIQLAADEVYTADPKGLNQAILGGVKDKSTYDVGLNLTVNQFNVFFNSRRSHYIEPFTGGGLTGEPYDYNNIGKINGYSPGFGYEMNHLDLSYKVNLLSWQNTTRVYWDNTSINSTLVTEPSIPIYGAPHWKDNSLGILSTFDKPLTYGDLLVGVQFEHYKVYDSQFPLIMKKGVRGEVEKMLPSGSESNSSVFMQYKVPFSTLWQANVGFRYDEKNRKDTKNIQQFSPRFALIYSQNNTDVKLSYSKSFVDATYWNRFSNLPSFIGADTLKPETLETLQLTPSFYLPELQLQLTTNVFYDMAKDVIFRDNSAMSNNYSNSGKLTSWGLEQELTYIDGDLQLRFNGTYRQAICSELIQEKSRDIANIPSLTFNFIVDKKLTESLWFNVSYRYIGKQFSPIVIQKDGVKVEDPFPDSGVNFDDPNHYLSNTSLLNTNIRYLINDNIELSLKVSNLLDKKYQQGGSTLHPYQKPGRWYAASFLYSF